ncbi:MAG: trehalose-6-phosphate synthase [Methylotenera sp.]|nr:trehalose-6-phosphate synthase [Oligoflexia bacterium]
MNRTSRLSFLSLFALTLTAFTVAGVQSTFEEHRQEKDAVIRATALATGVEESVRVNLQRHRSSAIEQLAQSLSAQTNTPTSLCVINGKIREFSGQSSTSLCGEKEKTLAHLGKINWTNSDGTRKYLYHNHPFTVAIPPVHPGRSTLRTHVIQAQTEYLVIAQDVSYLHGHWLETFLRTLLLTFGGGLFVLLLVATQVRNWIKDYVHLIRRSFREKLLRQEQETRTALTPAEIAQQPLRNTLKKRSLVIFANREPYIHQRKNDRIEVLRPASGLVTALEPILRQSGGMWVGHGSGSADREVANAQGEVAVPPGNPRYTLKRIWLSKEEEEGYYYGFSNEGLWPLCHLAHNRPTFRLSDWQSYCQVNERFGNEAPASILDDHSLILVQDYHFALLPRVLRNRSIEMNRMGNKGPKIAIFWHIPWPNPETFGICPWSRELLHGMLGSDVIGFHTQYHCNNFLETCDRYLEARIDWEKFSVTMDNHETLIRAFPIGIDTSPVGVLAEPEREKLRKRYGITAEFVAVGVDRLDYTKGLVERVEGVERFLEKNPEFIGRFSLVQVGSPSRSSIPAYQLLGENLNAAVGRVNERFGIPEQGYKPVILVAEHHEWDEIQYFYQLGDICMVTSLHDGMNLVAKEYIWCQRTDRGSLILSKFTGAASELKEAFIVNPYSTEEMADAISAALRMPAVERTRRMKAMREKVAGNNAFHWASDLIRTLDKDVTRPQGNAEIFQFPNSSGLLSAGPTGVNSDKTVGSSK